MRRPIVAALVLAPLCTFGGGAALDAEPDARRDAGGYWLSADLLGTPPARRAAVETLAKTVTSTTPQRDELVGQAVGHVETLEEALRWIDLWMPRAEGRPDELALQTIEAPPPGGPPVAAHGAYVTALVVAGATKDGGTRRIDWPADLDPRLPEGTAWERADLVVPRLPLFAAPAPRVPRAVERFSVLERPSAVWQIGTVDRCDGDDPPTCLRWAQIVARVGDRFHGGYVPAGLVTRRSAWLPDGRTTPRAQLVASGVRRGIAMWLLVARLADGRAHRVTVEAPLVAGRLPRASLQVTAGKAHVAIEGRPARTVPLDPGMDRRPRDPEPPSATR